MPELVCAASDLLVFIDDTGNEVFAGDQEYYGLGGCVILGQHYEHLKEQWAVVRNCVNGSADAPLHAAKLEQKTSNFEALSKFFSDRSFARIAVASIKRAILPDGMHPAVPVMAALQEDITKLAGRIPCSAVTIIVESSQRADPILRERFSELIPDGGEMAVTVNYILMPKAGAEPGLEVADFIINAAGSQTRRHLRRQDGFALDFNDVFCRLPPCGCLFSLINGVEIEADGRVRVRRDRLVGN